MRVARHLAKARQQNIQASAKRTKLAMMGNLEALYLSAQLVDGAVGVLVQDRALGYTMGWDGMGWDGMG
eukprot:3940459-Rhodomonas_salina.1